MAAPASEWGGWLTLPRWFVLPHFPLRDWNSTPLENWTADIWKNLSSENIELGDKVKLKCEGDAVNRHPGLS